ncbi:MAG: alpha-ketoglutarate-dependent dioxygenase AlkB, partial [Acidimicrobiia bacterium]
MFASDALQVSLFGVGEPSPDAGFDTMRRLDLDAESWLDYAPGWLGGDAALFDVLVDAVAWEQPEVRMYERIVRT